VKRCEKYHKAFCVIMTSGKGVKDELSVFSVPVKNIKERFLRPDRFVGYFDCDLPAGSVKNITEPDENL